MSMPTLKITRTIRSEQALDAFVEVVRKNAPLNLRNTRITAEDILGVLEYAHVHRLSVESACLELQQAPFEQSSARSIDRVFARPSRFATQIEPHLSPTDSSKHMDMQTRFQCGD